VPRGTTLRNIRIDDDLWVAVQEKAAAEERNVSDVVRELLRRWVARPPRRSQRALTTTKSAAPATLMIDGDDDRWAFAEMPDDRWKLYERTDTDDRIWTEVAHTSTYEDAVNARNDLASN
jgi:Arc/MetJ-type ribon-helix-helix transcriptional regulator